MTLRAKKKWNVRPMSWKALASCSNGSSMFSPTEHAPTSCAPRFAASMIPGPPPVMTANPRSPSRRPTSRASA